MNRKTRLIVTLLAFLFLAVPTAVWATQAIQLASAAPATVGVVGPPPASNCGYSATERNPGTITIFPATRDIYGDMVLYRTIPCDMETMVRGMYGSSLVSLGTFDYAGDLRGPADRVTVILHPVTTNSPIGGAEHIEIDLAATTGGSGYRMVGEVRVGQVYSR